MQMQQSIQHQLTTLLLFGVLFVSQLDAPKLSFYFYWAIQAGLLTPLTFAQHRLGPLAAFISSVYFLDNGRWWEWICEFYTANFKGISGGP